MALTKVQEKSAGTSVASASLAVTLEKTPTKGNLLTATANSDATLTMTSSGWTLGRSQVNQVGLYLWYKIAGEAESKEVKVTPSTSDSVEMLVTEWNPSKGGVPKFDVAASSNDTGVVEVGPTAETHQAEELAIVCFGCHAPTEPTYGAPGRASRRRVPRSKAGLGDHRRDHLVDQRDQGAERERKSQRVPVDQRQRLGDLERDRRCLLRRRRRRRQNRRSERRDLQRERPERLVDPHAAVERCGGR